MPSAPASARRWLLLIAALSLVPVHGIFTSTRIFFVRDLSFFFWSRHLWLRHTIFSGQAPWWDPYVASGQSAISDALNQLLMPVTLLVRLLPSDVISFNLWVALPLPVAALGMFSFLRRRLPLDAAAFGACVFALSGPVISTLNTPNLSWSVALMPWVFRGADAGPVPLAIAFALQALSGEPVTWVATGAIVAVWIVASGFDRKDDVSQKLRSCAALGLGALLASAQLVPTFLAGVRAHRAALATPDFWSLHPLSLWDAVAPNLFGNYYDAFLADLPWMAALNFSRDPFLYSLYVGPLVLLFAAIGLATRGGARLFWTAVAIVAIGAALGGYTPFYPLIRRIVPGLMYFRFPVKYIVCAAFAVAVLAANGWHAARTIKVNGSGRQPWTFAIAIALVAAGLAFALAASARPALVSGGASWLASATHLKDPAAGAAFLVRTAPPLAARGFALLLAGALLLTLIPRRPRLAAALLFAAVCGDLTITNSGLNLTMDAARLAPPAWYLASAGAARVYVGGRVRGYMNGTDPDGVKTWQIPAEATAIEGRMELNALLPMAPSGWRVREALSYDLPYLWPADYEATVRRFEQAGPEERAAFLRRSGVRRCVLPNTEPRQFRVVDEVDDWNMRVFECNAGASRVFIAHAVAPASNPADLAWQREGLFDLSIRDDDVRVATLPATAGRPSAPEPPSIRLVEDLQNRVAIEASLRDPGVVVLRDTFDPSWRATVDGEPAELVRANGIYRAVALPAGRHVVRFTYRPKDLTTGLTGSVTAALVLAAFSRVPRRGRAARQGGFTLVELMVVLAIVGILLAIAFNEYRGMQAHGNEASAIGSLRSIATAQWQFATTCANGKYSTTFPGLGQPVPTTGEAFLSPDLTSAEVIEKSGYTFQMTAKPLDQAPPACNGAAVAEGYAATADPVKPGLSGGFFYGVNADRIIYADPAETFKEHLGESGPAAHGVEVR